MDVVISYFIKRTSILGVKRGLTWTNKYKTEDGGHQNKGTVVNIQYVLQIAEILVQVKWNNNNHVNF